MTLELALEWASQGQRVLPVNGGTKRPLIKAWQDACTCDVEQIRLWWELYPHARVGMATGEPGFDILDFDVSEGKPGLEQLERLIDAGVIEPGTFRVVATPSGGRHLWFRGTDQRNKQNDKSVPGVDFRGVGGMVLVPGNPGYRWIAGAALRLEDLKPVSWDAVASTLAPARVAMVVESRPGPATAVQPAAKPQSRLVAPNRVGYENPVGEESPLDWFCNNNDLSDLLRADGWTYAYEHGQRWYWVRPGKDQKDGVSANVMINPDGRQTLMNFSTSVDLPTDRGLSAAQYWAYTRHRGDMRAAAAEIRRTLMPRRARPEGHGTTPAAGGAPTAPVPAPMAPEATRAGEVVPIAESGTPQPVRDFWRQRAELREMWWQAQVSDTSPWAVLGTVLGEIAARVGPHVVLPPKGQVGSPTSLNLLVAISGKTGEGKGTSVGVGLGFVGTPKPPHLQVGTGQGIAAMFTEQTKEGPVQSNDTVLINEDEISNIGAHMGQQGATLKATLLKVYMAEQLGEHYANKELRRPVRAGHYRLALVVGVQPDNAGLIFDHAASGLPQRFVWLPAHWDEAVLPEGELVPPAPGVEIPRFRAWPAILPGTLDDTLDATGWSPSDAAGGLSAPAGGKKSKEPEAVAAPVKDPIVVTYAPEVWREVRRDSRRRRNAIKRQNEEGVSATSEGDPDSHLLLTRLKIAALMAVWLDQTTHISVEMWQLAFWVLWVSNDTRQKAHERLRVKAAGKTVTRAEAKVAEQAIINRAEERERNATYIRALDRVLHLVTVAGDWIGRAGVNKGMSSDEKRAYRKAGIDLEDILSDLVIAGKLTSQETVRSGNTVTEYQLR